MDAAAWRRTQPSSRFPRSPRSTSNDGSHWKTFLAGKDWRRRLPRSRPAGSCGPTILSSPKRAKFELGVERVWTQAVVEHLAIRGLIDAAVAGEAHAKLMGFNYQVTQFRGSVIVAALRVSNGSLDRFPMRQMIEAFKPLAVDVANRNTALLMFGEFVLTLSLEPLLPETKCIATRALLDAFPADLNEGAARSSSRPVRASHEAGPDRPTDFLTCFEQWKRSKLTLL